MSISNELLSKAIKRNKCVVDGSTKHQLLFRCKDNIKQQRRSNYDVAHGVKRWALNKGYSIVSDCNSATIYKDKELIYAISGQHEYALVWACGERVLEITNGIK